MPQATQTPQPMPLLMQEILKRQHGVEKLLNEFQALQANLLHLKMRADTDPAARAQYEGLLAEMEHGKYAPALRQMSAWTDDLEAYLKQLPKLLASLNLAPLGTPAADPAAPSTAAPDTTAPKARARKAGAKARRTFL